MERKQSFFMAQYIAQNRLKTFLLIVLMPVSISVVLYLVLSLTAPARDAGSYMTGIFYGYVLPIALMSLVWMAFATLFGGSLALSGARAQQISREGNPEIYNMVERLAREAGLPTPKIYIMNDSSLNAFATGSNPKKASVALTRGIIQKLNREELEGVVAHELSHIGNRDTLIMVLVAVGVSVFVMVGERLMFSQMFRSSRRDDNNGVNAGFLIGIVFLVFGYLIAPLIRLAISRQREYQADACAARITGKPLALASALNKISSDSYVEALDKQESLNALCIANPSAKESSLYMALTGLMSTHPPIPQRIKALKALHENRF